MNNRYMDFVPTKSKAKTAQRGQAAPRVVHAEPVKKPVVQKPVRKVAAPVAKSAPKKIAASNNRVAQLKPAAKPVAKVENRRVVQPKRPVSSASPSLGVVEDLGGKKSNVGLPKRPLNRGPVASASEAKAKKVKAEGVLRSAPKAKTATAKPAASKANATYNTPKSPFINQSRVEKRPLSKNVYQKRIAVPKEEPKGPVTIITKPEKDSHVGIIVTIIMTIILGATAGTVAFLLLPK